MRNIEPLKLPITRRILDNAYHVDVPLVHIGQGHADITAADLTPNQEKPESGSLIVGMILGGTIASLGFIVGSMIYHSL